MKAIRFHSFGGPEHLVYEEVSKPVPEPGEVLIRVKACALNHLDLWVGQGIPAYNISLPHIPGCDVSGVVESMGEGICSVKPGARVFIAPGLSCFNCGPCLSGSDHLCDSYQIFGAGSNGGYAEFAKAPASNIIHIPDHVGFVEAAAFPLTFLTAWHMLIWRAKLRPGNDLLVLGGGSGVGSAAIQIGKLAGARVIATSGRQEKLDLAAKMGADILIDHSKDDFSQVIKKITDNRGVDIVFEHVGPTTFGQSVRSLALGGRLVTCGATTGPKTELDLRYLFSRELTIMGAKMGSRAELIKVAQLIGEGKLIPVIDSVFPLSQARAAQKKMKSRDLLGKIVLRPELQDGKGSEGE